LTLCNALRAEGWSVELVNSPAALMRVLRHPDSPRAGLIELSDDASLDSVHPLEACLRVPHIHWVAAAKPGVLKRAAVRELIASYCVDFVRLPYDLDALQRSLAPAQRMASLFSDSADSAAAAAAAGVIGTAAASAPVVGRSESIQRLWREVHKVARTDAALLLVGESGTGKQLTARLAHDTSPRAGKPFVTLSCGAIPAQLLQSELFGYERGAFTGADRRKIGKLEAAHGGTIFLDEVGDLPMECQASLLRFAQEGTIERVGGDHSIPLDVRIVSATHADLEAAVANGTFRFDLYHRLCVVRLDVPPLRERLGDIALLAGHILAQHAAERRQKVYGFMPSAIRAMLQHSWPGNIRELSNRIRRAIVMADGRYISARDLDLQEPERHIPSKLADVRDEAERQCVMQALMAHGNRVNEVAEELGISRVTLYRLRVRHGLNDLLDEVAPTQTQASAARKID
jgi:DNA-binding NtrC family response regulator